MDERIRKPELAFGLEVSRGARIRAQTLNPKL